MTSAQDLLRAAVLGTNPYWPFTHCNRWPYEAACHMLVRALAVHREIRSIYLRGSGRQGWIPGLSDIDVTLVLASELPVAREYELLASIWSTCSRLQRLFPMLGELETLDESEVAAWIRWTADAPHGVRWTLLHGEPNDDVGSTPALHWRRRAVLTALWFYLRMPQRLAPPDSSVRRHDLVRRVRKIRGLLQPLLAEAGQSPLDIPSPHTDSAQLFAGVLRALETAVSQLAPVERRSWSTTERADSVMTTRGGHTIVVVPDDLTVEALAARIRTRWRQREHPGNVVTLSHSLMTYLVRHLDPNEYQTLLDTATVEAGPHPLADIPPPDRQAFAVYATDRLFHLPLFVRGAELFSQPLSIASLGNQLNSALTAVQFLRHGAPLPYPDKREERWRSTLPHYVAPFEEVQVLFRGRGAQAAHQATFALLRQVLADARDLMTGDMPALPSQ